MAHIIEAMRRRTQQWLAVAVPREWNQDADRLSHPARLRDVRDDAAAKDIQTSVARVPGYCWTVLRAAMLSPGGDADFGGEGLGVLSPG